MKYRDAKKLQPGNAVKRKATNEFLFIKEVEILWASKIVRFTCVDQDGISNVVYNEEVE